jgi:hypothetical protein
LTAIADGHAAEVAAAEGLPAAALDHVTAAREHASSAPALASWLATIEATIHADRGDHAAARYAPTARKPLSTSPVVALPQRRFTMAPRS